ncbi:hypothetical protein K488DRAFT_43506 [Vararia minispora EC-137]|uniref:Uncharacterized protein n=1 Tax=Vararia minispora EC-137 TaxID=1314806 RepID=A0ACB8QTX6_9AGAM|nr:hypothetical protein K488DRAFT_43506 [Vararia minispora EC-137]
MNFGSPGAASPQYQIDDIRTEYHPRSGRQTETVHFDDYGRKQTLSNPVPTAEPWKPSFKTREDFELAEIMLEACMNETLTDRLLKIFQSCAEGRGKVTFRSYSDVNQAWEHASTRLAPFEPEKISVQYKGEDKEFVVFSRDLWQWTLDILQHRSLALQMTWDAERISKFNGFEWVRVIHEPWTAASWWDIQVRLPAGGHLLCYLLYADKTRLSSFGTAKGYPVVARILNLPIELRNGNTFGSGCVVGWLPIVDDDPEEKKKPGFVNFKRVVWHESFLVVIKTIAQHSKTGFLVICGDDVRRQFFPTILILSADYEEQEVMSLIRGFGGKRPCPVCLVPAEELSNLLVRHEARTREQSLTLIQHARNADLNIGERDNFLSDYGLRDNVFWQIANTDPHRALSFDRLHFNNSGLGGNHLWGELVKVIKSLGRQAEKALNDNFNAIPRWSGLSHFSDVVSSSFNDGTKHEDIIKLVVFAAHSIIPRTHQVGRYLLRCIRAYAEVDMHISFDVHTSDTIASGRALRDKFAGLILDAGETPKNWNFPKLHLLQHSFDDIEAKGVSANYNTKPSEKMHGPYKKAYKLRTNFRNVASQLLRIDHYTLTSVFLRDLINLRDEYELDLAQTLADTAGTMDDTGSSIGIKRPMTWQDFENTHKAHPFLKNIRSVLAQWLTATLPFFGEHSLLLPNGKVSFHPDDLICQYHLLRTPYESHIDWRQKTDNLHCSPSFHGHERNDYIIFQAANSVVFAQLTAIFACLINDHVYPVCIVRRLDAPVGGLRPEDTELDLHRVRSWPAERSSSYEIIPVLSVIRGALLVPDSRRSGDFLVMDLVDGDMYLRCKKIFGQQ